MDVVELEPFGTEVRGSVLDRLGPGDVHALRDLLARRGVLVLRGSGVDDDGFVRFLGRFGSPTFTRGETPVDGCPTLNVVSNVGRASPPRSVFHVDTTYLRRPPAYTALRAVTVPRRGGATLFTDQYRAYDTLPEDLRRDLVGRTIRHVATGVDLGDDDEREAEHPVFRAHLRAGRTALYLSTPERCVGVSGMSPAAGRAVIARLYEHSTRPADVLRHEWATGDVVIWDNRCVMHRADHVGVVGDRVLHRGVVDEP